MDIAVWLRSLGLAKYEAIFRENDIDETVLPSLTHENLKELGVASFGHRVKLLDAIAALHADTGAKGPSANQALTPTAPSVSPEDRAERRQVTVMFSDLVGSTALSARMDPEDLREVISAYQKCVTETVQRFSGFVAKYMGDGVLIYFGYPQAHEDDAERAVRAGLELVAAVDALKSHAALRTRVGIATGLVVVGDLIGSGASQEQAIVGETPNLAARLQGVAEPNSVVIAESTRKLVGNLFELENLGAQGLKGISGPVRVWAALRAASVESRFEAFHASALTELVGRDEEVELLLRRWSKAMAGEGQVVLLSGEAGIGKSRLTAALSERLATEPHTRLRYFCSPQHTDSALYPIISQMERAAGFALGDTAQNKLDKLDAVLAQSFTPPEDRALFAELLSLPNDGRYPTVELTPQQRRHRTLEALTRQIVALAEQSPVLMIFEDIHWIDPTSLEALGRGIDRIKSVGVLLIVTYRTEFEPPWVGRPYVTDLTLNRLGQREIAAMIDNVTSDKSLPENVKQDIVERTDGIPLFVEEMTKAVLEAESEGDAWRTAASVQCSALGVPASLHASLMARLDRLGPAKEVAQIGAAIGREFSHSLLAAVVHKQETKLQSALDRLSEAGLLFRQGVPPHASYLFKHALVQDAAYGTLLRDARRTLHARIAETIKHQFAETAENQPELLARHCAEAGLIDKAANLYGNAARRSLEHSAFIEAIGQLTRALNLIGALPATAALRRKQIELQVALITPLIHIKGHAASETKAAAEQARLLIEKAEAVGEPPTDPLLLFSVLFGFWAANFSEFNGDALCDLAAQFLALAKKHGSLGPIMVGHRIMGHSLVATGSVVEGRAHFDQSVALYNPIEHRPLATRFGQDVRVAALSYRSNALWMLGYPEAALLDADHTLRDAREFGQAAALMYALFPVGVTHLCCGNADVAAAFAQELIALAEEKRALIWKVGGVTLRGCVLASTGKPADAVLVLTSALAALRSTAATVFVPLMLSNLALAHLSLNSLDEASRCIAEATMTVKQTKEASWEAEVNRIGGQILLHASLPSAAKAEGYFERALTVARQQQTKSWELRAATSLARLWLLPGQGAAGARTAGSGLRVVH
jgi:class 3 adenylate cyclase/predicted ATPase